MPTFKLTLAYDGTGFVGWQRQASGTSIQGLLEGALRELDGCDVAVTGAGRTDAGVHAFGQVAGVTIARVIDPASLVSAVNAWLPESVRLIDAVEVADTFHARFHARVKTYVYRIWNDALLSPFERQYAWHVPSPRLDIDAMNQAASLIKGHHDFAAFQAAGGDTRTTERAVFTSRVDRGAAVFAPASHRQIDAHALVTYEICGNGFLRHMVRNIVGTLVEVGRGRRPAEWVTDVLASKERARAGPTAPPEGLFLERIEYE